MGRGKRTGGLVARESVLEREWKRKRGRECLGESVWESVREGVGERVCERVWERARVGGHGRE